MTQIVSFLLSPILSVGGRELMALAVVVERHLHRVHHYLLVLRWRRGAHPARGHGLWWLVTTVQAEKHHMVLGYRVYQSS